MAKKTYPPEFRARIVELRRSGRTIASLAREFGVGIGTIGKWTRQLDIDDVGRTEGASGDDKAELARLRKENARLREERDILKKAAAWFAQEAAGTSKRSSDS